MNRETIKDALFLIAFLLTLAWMQNMDLADQAQLQNDIAYQHDLKSSRMNEAPEPTGKCFNCGEKIKKPMRWCDGDCRDDWSARNNR